MPVFRITLMNTIGYINPNCMSSECSVANTAEMMSSLGCRTIAYEEYGALCHNTWINLLRQIRNDDTIILYSILDAFVSTLALRVFMERCVNKGIRLISLKESIDSKEQFFGKYLYIMTETNSNIRRTQMLTHRNKISDNNRKYTPPKRKKQLRDEKILNMYASSYPVPVILRECKVSRGTLYRILAKYNVPKDRTTGLLSKKKK